MDVHIIKECWRAPLACCQDLPQWGSCEYEVIHTHRAPADMLKTPESWRSRACPRRMSCVLYSLALGTPVFASMSLSALLAPAAVKPPKRAVPVGMLRTAGPSTCTGQVLHDSLHQHVRSSLLPAGRFFLRSRVRTSLPSSISSTACWCLPGTLPISMGSAFDGSRRRNTYVIKNNMAIAECIVSSSVSAHLNMDSICCLCKASKKGETAQDTASQIHLCTNRRSRFENWPALNMLCLAFFGAGFENTCTTMNVKGGFTDALCIEARTSTDCFTSKHAVRT